MKPMRWGSAAIVMLAGAALSFVVGAGCSSDDGGGGGGGDGSASGGSSATGGGSGSGGITATGGSSGATGGTTGGGPVLNPDGSGTCGDAACACSNGVDDDGDGAIDGLDAECQGPLDNDEGSFSTGIPGDNRDPVWQDCFFDGNSGAGDDKCRYHTGCLTGEKSADDPDCTVTQDCLDFCQARTPNGCDCFGCCTVTTSSGDVDIQIGGTCSLEDVSDEDSCPRCTKTTSCDNECGTCELCPGRTVADLPEECHPDDPDAGTDGGGPGYSCDDGQVCATSADCPSSYYCSLGCCLPQVR